MGNNRTAGSINLPAVETLQKSRNIFGKSRTVAVPLKHGLRRSATSAAHVGYGLTRSLHGIFWARWTSDA